METLVSPEPELFLCFPACCLRAKETVSIDAYHISYCTAWMAHPHNLLTLVSPLLLQLCMQ